MLGHDPLILTHIDNPDFEQRGHSWELKPAEPGGITFKTIPGFGDRQNRYPPPAPGDHVLMTRRSPRGPNVFSQAIRDLAPGRQYNLRMFTCDPHDHRNRNVLACSIRLDRATLLPEQCFTCVPTKKKFKALVTYHWRVFRAESKTARLTVSDWANDDKPGGPIGQEMAFNFIQIQPYLPER